jgi:gluconolactonase
MVEVLNDYVAEVIDPRFGDLIHPTAKMERLYTGCRWAEGPAYFPAGKYLVWSDIPNNRLMRYDECNDAVSVFRQPSNNSNGNTVDRLGRLISCEHLGRRVVRTEFDGTVTVIADRYDGKRLNSPNDVVVKSDGSIWFTDPAYGIDWDYEGERAETEIGSYNVYRVDPQSGDVTVVADDFVRPNGIAFSPDESKVYIADTGATHQKHGPRHIRVLDVGSDGRLGNSRVFATCEGALFDGFRIDEAGRLWTSAGYKVEVYEPDGTLIGRIKLPEIVANVCFGGYRRNRLYICGTTSLYAYYVLVRGAKTF